VDQIEVFPQDDGRWNWQKRIDGDVQETGNGYQDRSSAIEAARAGRGDEVLNLVRDDGSVAGTTRVSRGEGLRVVLLRADGSEYGELDPAGSPSPTATLLTLTPAGTTSEAVRLDG
jgi:hypothetical protein